MECGPILQVHIAHVQMDRMPPRSDEDWYSLEKVAEVTLVFH